MTMNMKSQVEQFMIMFCIPRVVSREKIGFPEHRGAVLSTTLLQLLPYEVQSNTILLEGIMNMGATCKLYTYNTVHTLIRARGVWWWSSKATQQ